MLPTLCETLLILFVLNGDACARPYDIHIDPQVSMALESNPTAPVWIFLKDKNTADQDLALEQLENTYNPRAIARRIKRRTSPGLFDERDLPLADSYVTTIASHVQRVRVRSRWLNAVSADITADQLAALARLPFVRAIQIVRRSNGVELIDEQEFEPGNTNLGPGDFYGASFDQLQTINLPLVHQQGFTGQGIIIGVLDTGFKRTHVAFTHPDHPLNVIAEYDFINDDPNTAPQAGDDSSQHSHGTLILGTMAAYEPGTYVGAAYDAAFILCKTEDITDEYQGEEDFYVAGLEFIESNGGDVATSSLTYLDWYTQADMDGQTAVTTIGVNTATDNGVHCCTAVGNAGHDSNPSTSRLGAPADAYNVFSVGSVNVNGQISGFSTDGPTADGRTKPEVLAVGSSTVTISSSNNTGYTTASGTSLATPLAAAAIASVLQSDETLSVGSMRDAFLFHASYYVANGTFDPLHVQGYGIMDSLAALNSVNPLIVAAESYHVSHGTHIAGGAFELAESDDADFMLQRSSSDIQSRIEFEVKAFSPVASPSSLAVTLEASVFARTQVDQTIELFDYVANEWEQVDTRAAARFTDATATVAATGDLSRFVEAGTMCLEARIRFQSPVARQQFSSNADQFIWTIGQ